MSRHWNPNRSAWAGRRQPRRTHPGEVAAVIAGGLLIGLWSAGGEIAMPRFLGGGSEVADPWATRIIDGDTIEYRGQRVRIADIDTPEVHGDCPYETELAARATRRMGQLLGAGPFELRPILGRDSDVYGRKLRIVLRDGQSLGQILVAEGLARPWRGHRQPWC